jgi:hypothetical protein
MMTLANALREAGDLAKAHSIGEEAVALYQSYFGAEHPFTLAAANNLAIVYRALHMIEQASTLDTKTHESLILKLGEDHPYCLCSAGNISNNLALMGHHAEAGQLSAAVLHRSRRVRVGGHPYTLACVANYSLDLAADAGELAGKIRSDAIERMRQSLGPDHPVTVSAECGRRIEFDIEVPPT